MIYKVIMRTSSKTSILYHFVLIVFLAVGGLTLYSSSLVCATTWSHRFLSYSTESAPRDAQIEEVAWPEQLIDPTVKYGLNFVLPDSIRNGLVLDAGYDRWRGAPTITMDYFMPLKAWPDKTVFLSPRLSLTGNRESFSVDAGIRKLLGSDAMVGVHTFHDWVRTRGSNGTFLKDVGVGVELSALPGKYSDLNLTINAYAPLNERRTVVRGGRALAREALSYGADAQLSFLLPAISDRFDIRLDGKFHAYRARATDVSGHSQGVTVSSRDGILTASFAREMDSFEGENFRVNGGLSLAFDWVDLLEGKNPFSAPYGGVVPRYNRKIGDSLYARPVRQYDLPADRTERAITLVAAVDLDTLAVRGRFPDIPNSRVTLQVAQSPWRDLTDLTTDTAGAYKARVFLQPGKYRVRLIHKPTGLVTSAARVVIQETEPETSQDN